VKIEYLFVNISFFSNGEGFSNLHGVDVNGLQLAIPLILPCIELVLDV
jgi:hypothetical protein